MDKILGEVEYQSKGCTDEECAVELWKQLNADRIVIGGVVLAAGWHSVASICRSAYRDRYIPSYGEHLHWISSCP